MLGNIEVMVDLIEKGFQEVEVEVDCFEVMDIDNVQLFNDYDYIIMGIYMWGDGDLFDEFLDFVEDMDEIDFFGKICVVFGFGDMVYEFFCGVVDMLEVKIKECGGEIVLFLVKIENNLEGEEEEELMEFGR